MKKGRKAKFQFVEGTNIPFYGRLVDAKIVTVPLLEFSQDGRRIFARPEDVLYVLNHKPIGPRRKRP